MTSVYQDFAAVMTIIVDLAIVILVVLGIPVAWQLRKTYRKIHQVLERSQADIGPIVQNANVVSNNLSVISTAIRKDIDKVDTAIRAANDRVQHAVLITEQQLSDFNALLTVVREEAEQLFLSTASTVRGVQRGTQAFRHRGGMDLASDELDAAATADDMMTQEEGDGHNRSTQSAAQALPAAPRVRPRPGKRRRA